MGTNTNQARTSWRALAASLYARMHRHLSAAPVISRVLSFRDRLSALERTMVAETQATAELVQNLDHMLARLRAQINEPEDVFTSLVGAQLKDLGPGAASFLNYSGSHRGFAGQRGLWFNPPLSIGYEEGGVEVADVNERIVEVPYVLMSLARMPGHGQILDLGCAENTLAFSLGSLGYETTALDLTGYPLRHPRVTVVTDAAESWEGPTGAFDAVISLSSLEHVGLSAYGGPTLDANLDRTVVKRIAQWLKPSGVLIMTAPWGRWSVSEYQRVYDDEHLSALLDGWAVIDRRYGVRTATLCWETFDTPPQAPPADGHGVVMLTVRPSH